MAVHIFRDGKWFDKESGEEVKIPERPASWYTGKTAQILRDIDGYTCPVSGKWIEGRAAHRENLKRTGCRIFEPGEREHYIKEKPREIERHAEKAADFLSDRIAERWPG